MHRVVDVGSDANSIWIVEFDHRSSGRTLAYNRSSPSVSGSSTLSAATVASSRRQSVLIRLASYSITARRRRCQAIPRQSL